MPEGRLRLRPSPRYDRSGHEASPPALHSAKGSALAPRKGSLRQDEGCPHQSVFERADSIEAEGEPLAYVADWLALAAQSPEWITQQEAAWQLALF